MLKRLLVSAGVAAVVLGAVTGFAASLNVNSTSLGAGNSPTVSACNSSASVSYTVSFVTSQYVVNTAPVTTAAGCANKSYSVTLTLSAGSPVTVAGTLDGTGAAAPSFLSSAVPAANVTGVSVAITG